MRLLCSLLFMLGLASCGAPTAYVPSSGFDNLTISGQSTTSNGQMVTPPAPITPAAVGPVRATKSGLPRTQDYVAQRQIDAEKNRQINRAMESSFGRGTARNGRMVDVAGTPMSLRVVSAHGYSFAVMQKTGINWGGTTGRELFPQMIQAAQVNTGCTPSGKVSMQRHSNGAHTRYSVHLNC